MNTYNELSRYVRYSLKSATEVLTGEKYGIQNLKPDQLHNVAHTLKWRTEWWMKASAEIRLAMTLAGMLEKIAIDACGEGSGNGFQFTELVSTDDETGAIRSEMDFHEAWFDAQAEVVIKQLASMCLQTIFRGTLSTGMAQLEEIADVEAAKTSLERFCGLGTSNLCSPKAMDDLFDGVKRRRKEEDEARAKIIRAVRFNKMDNGRYRGVAISVNDVVLDVVEWTTKNRTEAKGAARAWAEKLQGYQQDKSITVEAL